MTEMNPMVIGFIGVVLTAVGGIYATSNSRWKTMLDSQRADFKAVTDPMQKRLGDLERDMGGLTVQLKTEATQKRTGFEYIRVLLHWAKDTHPDTPPPPPPPSIASEL